MCGGYGNSKLWGCHFSGFRFDGTESRSFYAAAVRFLLIPTSLPLWAEACRGLQGTPKIVKLRANALVCIFVHYCYRPRANLIWFLETWWVPALIAALQGSAGLLHLHFRVRISFLLQHLKTRTYNIDKDSLRRPEAVVPIIRRPATSGSSLKAEFRPWRSI